MTTLEKIAKIKKVELEKALLEESNLVVALTTKGGLLVAIDRPDEEGSNWETKVIAL